METSMTVLDAYISGPGVVAGKATDLNGDEWIFQFRPGWGYYPTEMMDGIFRDLQAGRQPFLTCRYNEARDVYVVVDDHDNEVLLSRFSNWKRLG